MIAYFVFLFFAAGALSIFVYALRYGIGPMPTSKPVRRVLLEAVGLIAPGSTIVELGAGWGHLAFALAARFPESNVIAYEISPIPWLFCRVQLLLWPRPNLIIKRADFFLEDLSRADAVVCYLYPGAMQRLAEKLQKELAPSAIVLTSTFCLPGWEPEQVYVAGDLYCTKLYRYGSLAKK